MPAICAAGFFLKLLKQTVTKISLRPNKYVAKPNLAYNSKCSKFYLGQNLNSDKNSNKKGQLNPNIYKTQSLTKSLMGQTQIITKLKQNETQVVQNMNCGIP